LIERIVGEKVRVIDPAPAVAKQAKRLLEAAGTVNQARGGASIRFFTSGRASEMKSLLPVLLGEAGHVEEVVWKNDREVLSK